MKLLPADTTSLGLLLAATRASAPAADSCPVVVNGSSDWPPQSLSAAKTRFSITLSPACARDARLSSSSSSAGGAAAR